MNTIWRTAIAAPLAVLLSTGAVAARDGATGIVKQRMDAMDAMAAAVKAIGAALKSNGAIQREALARHAQTVADQGDRIVSLFPAGSGGGVSRAAPAIWNNEKLFADRADALVDAAIDFNSVAEDGDRAALTAAFAEMGRACSACHQDFRLEKRK